MKTHQVKTSEKLDRYREKLVKQFRVIQAELRSVSDDAIALLAINVMEQDDKPAPPSHLTVGPSNEELAS